MCIEHYESLVYGTETISAFFIIKGTRARQHAAFLEIKPGSGRFMKSSLQSCPVAGSAWQSFRKEDHEQGTFQEKPLKTGRSSIWMLKQSAIFSLYGKTPHNIARGVL